MTPSETNRLEVLRARYIERGGLPFYDLVELLELENRLKQTERLTYYTVITR